MLGGDELVLPAGFFARVQAKLYESFGETLELWHDAFHITFKGVHCVGVYRSGSDKEVDVWVRWMDDADCNAWYLLHEVSCHVV